MYWWNIIFYNGIISKIILTTVEKTVDKQDKIYVVKVRLFWRYSLATS